MLYLLHTLLLRKWNSDSTETGWPPIGSELIHHTPAHLLANEPMLNAIKMPNSNDEIKPTLLTPARTRGNSFSISATARLFLHLAPYLPYHSNKKKRIECNTHTHPIYAPHKRLLHLHVSDQQHSAWGF